MFHIPTKSKTRTRKKEHQKLYELIVTFDKSFLLIYEPRDSFDALASPSPAEPSRPKCGWRFAAGWLALGKGLIFYDNLTEMNAPPATFFSPGFRGCNGPDVGERWIHFGWDDPFLCSLLNLKYDGTSSPWNNYNHHSEKV